MPKRTPTPQTAEDLLFRRFKPVLQTAMWLAFLGLLGLIAFGVQTDDRVGASVVAVLVGLASSVVGFLAGFVFGIPRALQESGRDSRTGYAVNTNLEQISDWLTKIIVGVGLVEITRLLGGFSRLTSTLAVGMGSEPASRLVTGADMLFFASFGFMTGYLLTRTYFSYLFQKFDTGTDSREEVNPALKELAANLPSQSDPDTLDAGVSRASADSTSPISPLQNREPVGTATVPPSTSFASVDELRGEITKLLAELLVPRDGTGLTPPDMIALLEVRGVLSDGAAAPLRSFFAATALLDSAARTDDEPDLMTSGGQVLQQLRNLRAVAAPRFEDYVLARLAAVAEADWTIELDADIDAPPGAPPGAEPVCRVDARVRRGSREVIVEVRASLSGTDNRQRAGLQAWVEALPAGLPVVLVVLSDGPVVRDLIRTADRLISVLHWDRESGALAPAVRHLL